MRTHHCGLLVGYNLNFDMHMDKEGVELHQQQQNTLEVVHGSRTLHPQCTPSPAGKRHTF
jgi:hypothetical protein